VVELRLQAEQLFRLILGKPEKRENSEFLLESIRVNCQMRLEMWLAANKLQ
jgi:hypothetical protein